MNAFEFKGGFLAGAANQAACRQSRQRIRAIQVQFFLLPPLPIACPSHPYFFNNLSENICFHFIFLLFVLNKSILSPRHIDDSLGITTNNNPIPHPTSFTSNQRIFVPLYFLCKTNSYLPLHVETHRRGVSTNTKPIGLTFPLFTLNIPSKINVVNMHYYLIAGYRVFFSIPGIEWTSR